MLGRVLAHPPHVCLDDMVAVEVRHLSVALYPDLELRVRGDVIERGDVQLELACLLCEFPQTGADREQLVTRDGRGEFGNRLADVVDALALEPEYVRVVGTVDQVCNVAAHIRRKLLEEPLGLLVG